MEAKRLGKRIKAFRKLKRHTQREFAKELGISLMLLGKVERGVMEPSPSLLKQIARVLDIEVEELIQIENETHDASSN